MEQCPFIVDPGHRARIPQQRLHVRLSVWPGDWVKTPVGVDWPLPWLPSVRAVKNYDVAAPLGGSERATWAAGGPKW